MKKLKIPRFSGRTEIWISPDSESLFVRESLTFGFLKKPNSPIWEMRAFHVDLKLFNGSKYLAEKGWTLVGRI